MKHVTMMRALVPLFVGLLKMVASRSEPIDSSTGNIVDRATRDYHHEMFLPSGNINSDPNDFTVSMALAGRHRQVNRDDGRNEPRDWDELESRDKPETLNTRKIVALDDIDGASSLNALVEESRSMDELDETDLNRLSTFLMKLLRQRTWEAPLVIVDEPIIPEVSKEPDLKTSDELESPPAVWKRSRYYRRYPWKRQHARSRHGYDYDSVHICEPSREDVFQLLVALHDVRQGDKRRVVNFCKRRRTAGTLFTGIRFLGRRK